MSLVQSVQVLVSPGFLGVGSLPTMQVLVSQGIAGVGVPEGGTTGQYLAKASNADFDTEWVTGGGGGGSITINTTPISGGTSGRILYDNAATVGEKAVTGTGDVVLATSPTLVTPALGTPSSGNLINCTGYPVASISMDTARILGRTTAGSGAVEQLTAGANLTLSGGSLNANVGLGANEFSGQQWANVGAYNISGFFTDGEIEAARILGTGPGNPAGDYLWAAYRELEAPTGMPPGPAMCMYGASWAGTFATHPLSGGGMACSTGDYEFAARSDLSAGNSFFRILDMTADYALDVLNNGTVIIGDGTQAPRLKTSSMAANRMLASSDANGSVAWVTAATARDNLELTTSVRNTIYVSTRSGATDTRTGLTAYDPAAPFATLQAALTASASGDVIVVEPGTYAAVTTPFTGWSGRTIHLQPGAVVQANIAAVGPSTFGVFVVDTGQTLRITGQGTITNSGTANILRINAGTATIQASTLSNSAAGGGVMQLAGGASTVACDTISSTLYDGVIFIDGTHFVRAGSVYGGDNAISSEADGTGTLYVVAQLIHGVTDVLNEEASSGGTLFVECQYLYGSGGFDTIAASCGDISTWWVSVQTFGTGANGATDPKFHFSQGDLGTMAYQDADAVAITGGTLTGITELGLDETALQFEINGFRHTWRDNTSISANRTVTWEFPDAPIGVEFTGNFTGSGTNTGDQTSIVGITGTMAEFDTACTDGNFVFQSQVSQARVAGMALIF